MIGKIEMANIEEIKQVDWRHIEVLASKLNEVITHLNAQEELGKPTLSPQEKWTPEKEEIYYYIASIGGIYWAHWKDDSIDLARQSFLGIFPNTEQGKQQALAVIERVKNNK